ncbi:Phosphoinositide phosphatase sac1 [Entomophthora muscae]|uniref:Phosphoinositide phosphatase sac1 n=1 Tax=Entomophthora muscae TaxID=34485 RepID=A0ACC2U6J6_9FUNG|nr:Phosphoinositide phosphatase sac1 [Entomophthora muscae]
MLITERQIVGELAGHSIYRVVSTKVYPFARNSAYLTPAQASDEDQYRALLDGFLQDATFYFSSTMDLTRNMQRQHPLPSPQSYRLDLKQADAEFFWNRLHLLPFQEITKAHPDQDFSNFLVPVIYGYVKVVPVVINGVSLSYGLITRRGTSRVGTRYFSRGVDEKGHVSNYAETEQVVASRKGDIASFSQVRGSIPVFWAQVTNTKYTPKLVIADRPETSKAFRTHFERLSKQYGPVVAVNLVNTKGYELPMAQKFAHLASSMSELTYIHFDFHNECSKMRWHRIQLLIDQMAPHLDAHMYYYSDPTKGDVTRQQGVIRTNCMDCLDRTNVVQSMVAKHILTCQLKAMGVIPQEYSQDVFVEPFVSVFRELWADNADAVSIAYSGTGALKTDFTRTGRRTTLGPIQDGKNSIVRYIKNNYLDGSRQDGIDLFLGRFTPSPEQPSPFQDSLAMNIQIALGIFLAGLTLSIAYIIGLIPRTTTHLSLIMGVGLILASFSILSGNRAELVARPCLVPYEYSLKQKTSIASELLEKPLSATMSMNETSSSSKPKDD